RSSPASTPSRMASAANGGGTKMADAVAPVCLIPSATVSKIGTLFSNDWPPLPGVTPATTCVPYARLSCVWRAPKLPVMPWTRSLVSGLTRMDMYKLEDSMLSSYCFHNFLCGIGHGCAADDWQTGIDEGFFACVDIVSFEANDKRKF